MLSVENPSDPSCSSKASALKSDERASDKLAFQEADPSAVGLDETQPPNFSIRDYVFRSRSKDIRTNWPFPKQSLQLCLNHGIKDLLPPFEPPTLVRAKRCGKEFESGQVTEYTEAEKSIENGEPDSIGPKSCLPSDQVVVGSSDQVQHPLSEGEFKVTKFEVISKEIKHDLIEGEREVAEPPLPEKLDISNEPLEKKCRLVVKLSAIAETSGLEELVSTLSTVSDSMASKVCPVCKAFTSTSNTTLNAHIDQCLSSECNNKRDVTKFPPLRVKPRKKRLMVDIYTTAPHCTLEDLDRRNGTNWATDLTLVAPTNEVIVETKRPKLSPAVAIDDGNEGEVYVDSNGTKLRILSKFNDAPPLMSKKDFKLGKHAKGIKAGRCCLITKKKQFKSKHSKFMKVNPQDKRLSSFKAFKDELETTPRGDGVGDAHREKEEESSSELFLSAQDQVKVSEPATLGQWVCSKRSDVSKKVNSKETHKGTETARLVTRNPLVENSSSAVRNHILKISRSSDALCSSPKTKRVDVLSNTAHAMGSGKTIFPRSSNQDSKLPSEADLSTDGLVLKLPRSLESFVPSPRSRKGEIHMGTLQRSDAYSGTKTNPSKRFHPSLQSRKSSAQKKVTSLERPSFPLDRKNSAQKKAASLERPSFPLEGNSGDGSEKLTKKLRKHRAMLGSSKWGGEMHSDVDGTLHSSKKDSGLNSASAKESNNTHPSDFSENVSGSSFQGYDHRKEELATTTLASSAKLGPRKAMDDDEEPISGSATQVELRDQISVNGQEIISNKIVMAGSDAEPRVDEDPSKVQYGQCRTNTAPIQEPSPSLTSHGEMDVEIAQEKSSITSIRGKTERDHNFSTDMEPSGSPVSTASTLSPPEQSAKPTPLQDKLISTVERKDQKVKEPCCSCSESLSLESQLARQVGKQMVSNLYIRPVLSSSGACPCLESPTGSIVTKVSLESAIKIPAYCREFGSPSPCSQPQTQAASNPILRLMGKDLVVSKEESPCDSNYSPKTNHLSLGFSSLAAVSNYGGFGHNNHQIPSLSSIRGQVPSMGSHQIPRQSHPKRPSKKPNSPSPVRMERIFAPHQHRPKTAPSSRAPYLNQEVIVIDDTPELEVKQKGSLPSPIVPTSTLPGSNLMPQRPFSCFPSQNPFASRVVRPPYPNSMKQGSNSEGSSPLLPSSFMFSTPLYYSQTL